MGETSRRSDGELAIGMTGLGGWAGWMLEQLLAPPDLPRQPVRLVVLCEPHPERFPRHVELLSRHQVRLVHDFAELLTSTIDAVYLPLPIALHRSFTTNALAAGKAVLCEKPAAGCVADVDAMIAARDRATTPALIAFKDIYQPVVQQVKRRLCRGEFGRVRDARVIGCWPRGERYYGRTDWAGKIRHRGEYVLDTPANNAFAHYIHLAMFLLGNEGEAARPVNVEAELYRVNPIETYDTCSLRIGLDNGVPMLVALSHACATSVEPEVAIITDKARIRYVNGDVIEILPHDDDNAAERLPLRQPLHLPMLCNFRDYVLGGPRRAEVSTLEMARAHTQVVAAASESGDVVDVPAEFTSVTSGGVDAGNVRVIDGIEDMFRRCMVHGVMLHELGAATWSRTANAVALVEQFAGRPRVAPSHAE